VSRQRKGFLDKIRKILFERRAELVGQLTAVEDRGDEQVKDLGDEALSSSMDKLQSSLEQAEIDEIKLVDDALSRIEKNEYGICLDCGDGISNKRLLHSPYAARCIVCQEALENDA